MRRRSALSRKTKRFSWIIGLAAYVLIAQVAGSQELELDENGQPRWRYSLDYANEVALARADAQPQIGHESDFQTYTQKIDELEVLAQELATLEQNQSSQSAIDAKHAELNQ